MFVSNTDELLDIEEYSKKLWEIELNMLKELTVICENHQIDWFLIGGGLIGAIRHKGFIPWDDDIDLGMLRKDYDRFVQFAPKELSDAYELQLCEQDSSSFHSLLRIRHKYSTGMLAEDIDKNINSGAFIEIYPYDNDTGEERKYKKQAKSIKFWVTLLNNYGRKNVPVSMKGKLFRVFSMLMCRIIPFSFAISCWNQAKKRYDGIETPYVNCEWSLDEKVGTRSRWFIEDVKNTITVPFENIEVKVPLNYDRCLRICYGDYMKIPDEKEQKRHHSTDVAYDPFTPYSVYQTDENRNKLKKILGR